MRIGVLLTACAMTLLAGCGLLDPPASVEQRPPEPEPDAKALVRAGIDTLFMNRPESAAVSRPRRILERGFSICVKATVAGKMSGDAEPVIMLVIIEHGQMIDRRRATSYDRCDTEKYEPVEIPPAPAQ